MKNKICFIINPISGIGKQKTIEKLIDKQLDKTLFDYEIMYTQAPKHATILAEQAVKNNFSTVVGVGGDGLLNEVAKGLIGSNTAMAIIPVGSGNGLARHLNIPLNLKKAVKLIKNGTVKKTDTVRLNDETFINMAGVGFDAHIGWEFSKYGKRGLSSYVKLILREFPSYKEQEFELTIDGKTSITKAFLISFANGSQWGSNAYISPNSVIDDGFFEIAILKNVSIFNFVGLVLKLLNKKLHLSPHLHILKAKKAIIKQTKNIAHIDGEPIEIGKTIAIKINPASLNIIVP